MDGVLERLARAVGAGLTVVMALAASGCAPVDAPCTKIPITVAKKDVQSRVEVRRGAPRRSATGSMEETQETVRVIEYRVAAEDGTWYRVTEAEYEAIAPRQRVDVCK